MTHPKAKWTTRTATALAAILLVGAATPSYAGTLILADDFESYTPGALGTPWNTTNVNINQTIDVVNTHQSDFGPVGHGQAVRADDNDAAADTQLYRDFTAPTDRKLIVTFDFMLLASNGQPTMFLQSGSTNAIALEFKQFNGDMTYRNGAGERVSLVTPVLNDWYRATLTIDPLQNAVDSWSLRLQRHDGTSIVQDLTFTGLDFSSDVASINRIRFRTNVGGQPQGDYLIDNLSIVAVPEPAAAGVMGFGLALAALRRRR